MWILVAGPLQISSKRHRHRQTSYYYEYFDSMDSTTISFDDDPIELTFSDSFEFSSLMDSVTTSATSDEGDPSVSSMIEVMLTSEPDDDEDGSLSLSMSSQEDIRTISTEAEEIDPTVEDVSSTMVTTTTTDRPNQQQQQNVIDQEERERRVFGAHMDIINRIRGRPNGLFIDPHRQQRRQHELKLFQDLVSEERRGVDRDRLAEADPRSLAWEPRNRRANQSCKGNQRGRRDPKRKRAPRRARSSSSSLSLSIDGDDPSEGILFYGDVVMHLAKRRPKTKSSCK